MGSAKKFDDLPDAGGLTGSEIIPVKKPGGGTVRTTVSAVAALGGGGGGGSGDVVGQTASVDSELALFSGTSGKAIKRATTTGLLKANSGVVSAAQAGTDYVTPTGTETLTNKSLTSPAMTGTPTAPTAAAATSTTQIATTAFARTEAQAVQTNLGTHTGAAAGVHGITTFMAGVNASADAPTARTALGVGTGTGDVVGVASAVDNELALFSGTTGKALKRATTTGVLKATAGVVAPAVAGTDYVTPTGTETLTNKSLTSPAMTGNPTATTQTAGNNSTRVATTEFVAAATVNQFESAPTVIVETTTARTLSATDKGKLIRCTDVAGCTITVPTAFTGLPCTIVAAGGVPVTLVASGTTINGSLTIAGAAALLPTGTANTWDLIGSTGSFAEDVQDVVGAMFVAGGGSYDDASATVGFPFPEPLPAPLRYSDTGGIRVRAPVSADNLNIGGNPVEAINLTSTIAALTLTLSSPTNDQECTVVFYGVAGAVTALTWAGADLKPAAAKAQLPPMIYGPTSIRLWWDANNAAWSILNIWRQYDTGAVTSPVASAATVNLWQQPGASMVISGTTGINSFGLAPAGAVVRVTFLASLVLGHNGTSQILPGGAPITTAAGDSLAAVSLGSSNWRVIQFTRAAIGPDGYAYMGVLSGIPAAASVPPFARAMIDEAAVSGVKMRPLRLISTYGDAGTRVWAPDGRQVLFAKGGNLANALATITMAGATGTLATIGTLPANLLALSGMRLSLYALVTRPNSGTAGATPNAAVADAKLTIGGVDVATVAGLTTSITRGAWLAAEVVVRNATSQTATQTVAPMGQANVASTANVGITGTSAAAIAVNIAGATASDEYRLLAYSVTIE